MNDVQNPHDKLFKALMSDNKAAAKFLVEFLPPEIVKQLDLTKLERMESSFVTNELSEIFADIVFRIPLADSSGEEYVLVSILIEHKSHPDDLILLQVGQYLFQAYQKQIKGKGKPLELIIPLVYYHGKERWKIPPFSDLFPSYSESLQAFIPPLKIVFHDLGLKADDDILGMDPVFLAVVLWMQKYAHDEDILLLRFEQWTELLGSLKGNRNQFQVIVVYYLQMLKTKKSEVMEKIKELTIPVKEELLSVADQLRQEGIEQGIEQKEYAAIKNMIKKGVNPEFISEVLEVSMEYVESVRKEMEHES